MMSCIAPKKTIGTTNLESSDILWSLIDLNPQIISDWSFLMRSSPVPWSWGRRPAAAGFPPSFEPRHWPGQDALLRSSRGWRSQTSETQWNFKQILYFKWSQWSPPWKNDLRVIYGFFSVSFRVSFTGSSGFKFGFHLKGFNQSFLGCRLVFFLGCHLGFHSKFR